MELRKGHLRSSHPHTLMVTAQGGCVGLQDVLLHHPQPCLVQELPQLCKIPSAQDVLPEHELLFFASKQVCSSHRKVPWTTRRIGCTLRPLQHNSDPAKGLGSGCRSPGTSEWGSGMIPCSGSPGMYLGRSGVPSAPLPPAYRQAVQDQQAAGI